MSLKKYHNSSIDSVFEKDESEHVTFSGGNWRLEYSENKYLSFIHVPKTAGVSVWRWVMDNFEHCDYQKTNHLPPVYMEPLFEKRGGLGTTFAIIRNPYDWVVSRYTHYIQSRDHTEQSFNFDKYVWLGHTEKGRLPEPEDKPKTHLINFSRYYESTKIILRYEYLEEEFELIQELTGCYTPLGLHNVSSLRQNRDYRSYYSERTKRVIEETYGPYFKKFNYEW